MVTSNLLVQGVEPRRVVGTVNSVEFFLTLTVSAAFIYHLGLKDFATATLGLLIGGVAAAPLGAVLALAAWFLPRRRTWALWAGLAATGLLVLVTVAFAVLAGGVSVASLLLLVLSVAGVTSLLARTTRAWLPGGAPAA